jgi:hypothetical protein
VLRHNARVGQSVVQLLVAAVAAAASLTAVLLGIDQLSSGGRLRNLESVLRAAVATPDGTGRDEVLASLHRMTLGRLIAREAVPFRSFLAPFFLLVFPVMGPVEAALLPALPWWAQALLVVLPGAFMGMGLQQILYLAAERIRIRSSFEDGLTPLRVSTWVFPMWMARRRGRLVYIAYAEGLLGSASIYFGLREFQMRPFLSWHAQIFAVLFAVAAGSCAILSSYMIGSLNRDLTVSRRGVRFGPSWVHPPVELWIPSPRRVKDS